MSNALNRLEAALLEKLDAGWQPLWLQVGNIGKRLEKRGFVRADYGEPGTPDEHRLVVRITPAGRLALSRAKESPTS